MAFNTIFVIPLHPCNHAALPPQVLALVCSVESFYPIYICYLLAGRSVWAFSSPMSQFFTIRTDLKVDGTSFQVFWICKLWKERTQNQPNIITKFVYDSIAKFVLVPKRQLFCHQLLPWQRYLMIVQTYFWASNAYILKTNLMTPNFFHISFFVIWKWNHMII